MARLLPAVHASQQRGAAPLVRCTPPPVSPRCTPHHSRPGRRWGVRSASSLAPVHESLTLLRLPAGGAVDEAQALLDEVWSLQYVASGPICGTAGAVTLLERRGPAGGSGGLAGAAERDEGGGGALAGVLFRFGRQAQRDTFFDNPATREVLGGTAAAACEGACRSARRRARRSVRGSSPSPDVPPLSL